MCAAGTASEQAGEGYRADVEQTFVSNCVRSAGHGSTQTTAAQGISPGLGPQGSDPRGFRRGGLTEVFARPRRRRACGYFETVFAEIALLPTVLIVVIFTIFFSAVTFTTRYLVRRRASPERQQELVTLAEAMNGPTGVAMAFLIGFSVTISWGTISTAQSAVEKVAASTQEVAWLTENLSDRRKADEIVQTLKQYLETISTQDQARLADGDLGEMPSFTYLDVLENQMREVAAEASARDPEASRALTAASTIAQNQADLVSIARRQLPTSMLWLLLVAGTLSSMVMGIVATKVERPFLLVGWALVSAIGISVVLSLYNPFAGGVAVDMQPLDDAAQRILLP